MSLNVRIRDWVYQTTHNLERFLGGIALLISSFAVMSVVYLIGFFPPDTTLEFIIDYLHFSLIVFLVVYFIRLFIHFPPRRSLLLFFTELVLVIILAFVISVRLSPESLVSSIVPLAWLLKKQIFLNLLIATIFIIEVSKSSMSIYKIKFNPSLLYVSSFFFLIILGTGMLLLPRSTNGGLSFIDALFTSTSAVCVTGLITVDTATQFTSLGKFFIMSLIQVGGLGVMLFTSFFGFFFQGGFSFQNQLFLKDFINEDKLGQIVKTMTKILLFTFIVEAFGAIIIFHSIFFVPDWDLFYKIKFSIFHSISAFCNAGFSTLTNGLYTEGIRENYEMIVMIGLLIIAGGIGFPVIINLYYYSKSKTSSWVRQIFKKDRRHFTPRILNVNTRIVLTTTTILLVFGMLSFLVAEWNGVLKGMDLGGKLAISFFGSVTPRTAGFNVVDMNALAMPTILICFVLMWIGASPGSTGGGIKTSTIAIALMNIWSIIIGRNRVEIFKREIQYESIQRAFAIIVLSILAIGTSIFLIMCFDPQMPLKSVAFECVSAFSTVGLSLGITAQLGSASKLVLIFLMFVGRIGTLTILVAFIRKISSWNYHYPKENVNIT